MKPLPTETAPALTAVCSSCGQPLSPTSGCLACLLRDVIEESVEEVSPVFGDFEIARREDGSPWELGRGAMGVTYRALDKVLNRAVALKVIETPAAASSSQAMRDRFLREARAAAALRHPNVAGVFHFGASREVDRCYYAMELVDGETLEARVKREGPLEVEFALDVAIQVTRALIAAEARSLIHRDLKPGNIMLTRDEGSPAKIEVKVIDFGLAKVATDGAGEMDGPGMNLRPEDERSTAVATAPELTHGGFVGTPAFASPEQFDGGPIDVRSDIYALGITLWFALSGRLPYAGRTIDEIRQQQRRDPLPLAQLQAVPQRVIELLRSCLALEPAERPASARALMEALESCRARSATRPRGRQLAVLVLIGVILAAALSAFLVSRQKPVPAGTTNTAPLPEKSIAVLPFENLSAETDNAFFAQGVQDDILTALTNVADLKVIGRTSVMNYSAGRGRDLRAIGQALGVTKVLEGSVRRTGDKVRVTAQLIDTRTNTHLWAETYDRDLADVFAIQSDIAQQIAAQLKAKLSPTEKSAIEERPTTDLAAYDLYLRARVLFYADSSNLKGKDNLVEAAGLLEQAVLRDPGFFLAYCQLARTHDSLYFWGIDHTPARLASADAAIAAAARLRPDSAETHLAQAWHFYHGYLDYGRARAEIALAQRTLASSAEILELIGFISRRQGHWEESTRSFEKARELDPRNYSPSKNLADNYYMARRFPEAAAALDRALELMPADAGHVMRANYDLEWRADTKPLHKTIEAIVSENPAAATDIAGFWLHLALCERDSVAANRALAAIGPGFIGDVKVNFPRAWFEGVAARTRGDDAAARAAFAAARVEAERKASEHPEYGPPFAALGMIDAALGRKEEAIREGLRAIELYPVTKDAWHGGQMRQWLAIIYAWTEEKDLALEEVAAAVRSPSSLHYGSLRLHPYWDPLRGDPRFEKLVADLAPKAASP